MTQREAERALELPDRYTKADLRAQFTSLAREYHPDNASRNGMSAKFAQRKMIEINKAYALLKTFFEDDAAAMVQRDYVDGPGVHFDPSGTHAARTQVDDSLFWDADGNPRSAVAEEAANAAVDVAAGTHRLRRLLLGPVFLRVVVSLALAAVWYGTFPLLPHNFGRFDVSVAASLRQLLDFSTAALYPTYFLVYELLTGNVSDAIRELLNGAATLATNVHVEIRPRGSYTSCLTNLIQKQWYGPLILPLAAHVALIAADQPAGPERTALFVLAAAVGVEALLGFFGIGLASAAACGLGNLIEKRYVTARMALLKRCGQWVTGGGSRPA